MVNSLSRRLLVVVALAAVVSTGRARPFGVPVAHAQGGDPVTMDIVVVGADGKPTMGLKPEQITLKLSNKARPIKSLQFVAPDNLGGEAAPASAFPPPYGSNPKTLPGRVLLLYVDEESIRAGSEKPLKDELDAWIDQLPATDKIGLVSGAHGSTQVSIGGSRADLHAAIAKLTSRRSLANSNAECRTREAMDELTGVIAAMGPIEGLKEILFFTNSMSAASSNAPISALNEATNGCNLTSAHIEKVSSALGLAQVHMYIVLPETLVDSNGVQNFSAITSSPVVNMDHGETGALARIKRETSGYYIASFEIDPSERGGSGMRLDVKSEGSQVHVPRELSYPKGDKAGAGKPVAKEIVKDQKAYTDVPIRVAAIPARGDATKMDMVVAVERPDPATKLSAATIGVISPDGKIISWSLSGAELDKPGVIMSKTLVPPGKYRVRVAVNDAAGRAGAADIQVDADLTPTGPMKLGGMMLGVKQASGSFTPKLMGAFKDEAEAAVYFELYGTPVQKPIDAKIELLEKPDGPALATATLADKTLVMAATNIPDKFAALGSLDISKLAPGDYLVKLTFAIEGETPGTLTRTLRKIK